MILLWNIEELFLYPSQNLIDAWKRIIIGDTNGILPYSWYVFVTMFFYCIFYFCYRYIKSERNRLLFIVACWALYFVFAHRVSHWGIHWSLTSHIFIVGMLYFNRECIITRINVYLWLLLMLIIALIGNIVFWNSEMLFYIAFSFMFICGITIIQWHSRTLDFLGKISYELYIVQALPLFALKDSSLPPFIIVILCMVIDIVLAYLLHQSTASCIDKIIL